MVLAVSIDSNRIPYLLISPENKALTLLSNLFSKAFQELARSRYLAVFDATAGNALCVKNTLLSRVPSISGLVILSHHLCDLLLSATFVSVDLFQPLGKGLKNLGPTGVVNMSDGLPSALLGRGCLQINMHKLVDCSPASQEEAEDANTGGTFWHLYTLIYPV